MRVLLIFILLPNACIAWSQPASDFSRVDREADFIDAQDPATLANLLTINCKTETEKVRSIFRWITGHISYYRVTPANRRKAKPPPDVIEEESDTLFPLSERVAIKVLKDRRTHCEGYARLFKSLCDHAGLTSAIVSGYARAEDSRSGTRFRSNHSWNAVYIDSTWRLLDVTWASGFITWSTENFVRQYNEYYFFTAPEQFVQHHYPDDLRWTLLAEPPAINEFRKAPYHQRSFGKYGITDFSPARGIIEATVGDTIRIQLETAKLFQAASIAPDSLWDSARLFYTPSIAYVSPAQETFSNIVTYLYPVNSDKIQWLHIMFNSDAVLRYRLNIRPRQDPAAPIARID